MRFEMAVCVFVTSESSGEATAPVFRPAGRHADDSNAR